MNTLHPRTPYQVLRSMSGLLGFAVAAAASCVCAAAAPDTTPQPADERQPAPQSQAPPSAATKLGFAAAEGEQRLALVIGNSKYKESPLANPANDARAMAVRLKQLGFKVIERENASLEDMRKATRDFGNQLSMSDVGLLLLRRPRHPVERRELPGAGGRGHPGRDRARLARVHGG